MALEIRSGLVRHFFLGPIYRNEFHFCIDMRQRLFAFCLPHIFLSDRQLWRTEHSAERHEESEKKVYNHYGFAFDGDSLQQV